MFFEILLNITKSDPCHFLASDEFRQISLFNTKTKKELVVYNKRLLSQRLILAICLLGMHT